MIPNDECLRALKHYFDQRTVKEPSSETLPRLAELVQTRTKKWHTRRSLEKASSKVKKKRDKKSVYVILYPKIDSRQENTNEHESDLRNNEHYLGNSENKAWKKLRPVRNLNQKTIYQLHSAFILIIRKIVKFVRRWGAKNLSRKDSLSLAGAATISESKGRLLNIV